ncbi:tetratricopeptide repeat protein [Alkalibacterium iburiense]|uniref:tetratricopeptide repeat protein n=1 Tax=Alkalibacterium iburiense TaxID=290589 RepID=UPI0031CF1AFD
MTITSGALLFIAGSLVFLMLFFIAVIGLIKGKIPRFKLYNRWSSVRLLLYSSLSALVLLVIWSVSAFIQTEYGPMTASEKIELLSTVNGLSEDKVQAFIQEYPKLEYEHITFTYHPESENELQDMLHILPSLLELEKEIYGGEVDKAERLNVLLLQNEADYLKLNPYSIEQESGSYYPLFKRMVLFKDDNIDSVGTFVHEYHHYLFDLYLSEVEIEKDTLPVWYNEGISEYMRKQLVGTPYLYEMEESDVLLTNLHTNGQWRSAYENENVYHLALKGVEVIVNHQSEAGALSDILLKLKDEETFEEAYTKQTGLDLNDLNEMLVSSNEEVDQAWVTWDTEGDYESAEQLYQNLLKKHPHDSLVWHQYAMMLEEQNKWDEALYARQKVIDIEPQGASSYLNTSYLLVVIDSEAAVDMAVKAWELTQADPFGNVIFVQQWMEEVTHFHTLKAEGRSEEAKKHILVCLIVSPYLFVNHFTKKLRLTHHYFSQ